MWWYSRFGFLLPTFSWWKADLANARLIFVNEERPIRVLMEEVRSIINELMYLLTTSVYNLNLRYCLYYGTAILFYLALYLHYSFLLLPKSFILRYCCLMSSALMQCVCIYVDDLMLVLNIFILLFFCWKWKEMFTNMVPLNIEY